jgi:hypothetical protein
LGSSGSGGVGGVAGAGIVDRMNKDWVIVNAAELLLLIVLVELGETEVPVLKRLVPLTLPRPIDPYPSEDKLESRGNGIGLDRALSYTSK